MAGASSKGGTLRSGDRPGTAPSNTPRGIGPAAPPLRPRSGAISDQLGSAPQGVPPGQPPLTKVPLSDY
jgi:hypothetical protein